MTEQLMWAPGQALIEQANVTAFARRAIRRWKLGFNTYPEFYAWSVDHPQQFWDSVWDYCGVIASNKGARVLVNGERMPGASWFPEARLNFAENLLRRSDATDAFVFWDETGFRRRISYAELQAKVSRVAQAMRADGLAAGDRVAAFMPNMPETGVLALAAISIGAVWSCCSPDFGTDGVLDRFGQTGPKMLFSADGYLYNGKAYASLARVQEIAAQLPSVRRVVAVPHLTARPEVIYERIKHGTHRPLLRTEDPRAKIRELLESRARFYQEADLIIDTSEKSVDDAIREIKEKVMYGRC